VKRTALKRKTPLRRRTRLRPFGNTKYRRRERDVDFMLFVLTQPCAVRSLARAGACDGRVQADHAGARGLGVKAPDDTCIPLCMKHHGQRTDYRGFFKNWKGPQMRAWADLAIHQIQNLYADLCALGQTPWRKEARRA